MHGSCDVKYSDFKSFANLLKSAVGTGLFAMPNAFASVGLVIGIIGTIIMGLLVTVSLHILLRIHHMMCIRVRQPTLHYDAVVVASLTATEEPWMSTRVARYLVDVTILACYIGIGAVYIVFVSGIAQDCFDTEKTVDLSYYALMLFPLFFLINLFKYLKDIAIISIVGNVCLFLAATWGVVYALKEGIGDDWVLFNPEIGWYAKFIGTAFFSMSSPGVVLVIQHDMEKPWNYTKFNGVLNWGMLYVTLLHTFIGVVGYLKWGSRASGNFLRNHGGNDLGTVIALVLQALAIYFTYGIQCYLPITVIMKQYILPALQDETLKGSPFYWDLFIRFLITFVNCILAAIIPRLDLFIGIVGSVSSSLLSSLIPVTLYLLVHYGDYGRMKWRLIVGLMLLIISASFTISAITVNVILTVIFFSQRHDSTSL